MSLVSTAMLIRDSIIEETNMVSRSDILLKILSSSRSTQIPLVIGREIWA